MTRREPDEARGLAPVESSPLDKPLNSTYVGVLATEFVIVVVLVILGKIFS